MAYNSRMSIMPTSQQQSRSRKKEEDDLMRLTDEEIVGCINDIGIPYSVADLQKPNPLQVQMIFEWFAELLLDATRETIEPAMRAAAEDVCGEYGDILMPSDTRNLMGFYVQLRRLILECGIADFSFTDIYKPTYDRLVRTFSYIINFVRFRESQTEVIDEHFNKGEKTKARIQHLHSKNQELEARLQDMRHRRKVMERQVEEKTKRNEDLKKCLLELRSSQEKVGTRLEEAKAQKNALAAELEEKTAAKLLLKQESAKLRPYVLQSPAALQANLDDLNKTLASDKAYIDSMDRRARALQTSADAFAVVAQDVVACNKLLNEIAVELAKADEENDKNTRQRDALSEKGAKVRDVERREDMLRRQLAKWEERTETLKKQSADKAAQAKEKMERMRATHQQLSAERSEKMKGVERRRVRIEQTEKKMIDLKETMENEIHAAHDEYLKLEAHVKLYITEMEQAL